MTTIDPPRPVEPPIPTHPCPCCARRWANVTGWDGGRCSWCVDIGCAPKPDKESRK